MAFLYIALGVFLLVLLYWKRLRRLKVVSFIIGAFYALNWLYSVCFRKQKEGATFLKGFESWMYIDPANKGVMIDGHSLRISEETSFEHVAIFAPTGKGKTQIFSEPNLYRLASQENSIIVSDPSGELYERTSGDMKAMGREVFYLNPSIPSMSHGYDPLANVHDFTTARELARAFIASAVPGSASKGLQDDFWNKGAVMAPTSLIRCLAEVDRPKWPQVPSQPNWRYVHNLLYLLQNFGEKGEPLYEFISNYAPDQQTINQFASSVSGNSKTFQSFLTVATVALDELNNPDTIRFFTRNDIDFRSLRKKKSVIYLALPSHKMGDYSFVMNLFYKQFFDAMFEELPKEGDLPVYCLMDEFGHSAIPGFSTIATTIRKYKVSLCIVLQDLNQLCAQYGEKGARVILNNMGSKIFLGGLADDTAIMVQNLLGKTKAEYKTNTGETVHKEGNLMNADRIRALKPDEALFVYSHLDAVKLKTVPAYKQNLPFRSGRPASYPKPPETEIEYVDLPNQSPIFEEITKRRNALKLEGDLLEISKKSPMPLSRKTIGLSHKEEALSL